MLIDNSIPAIGYDLSDMFKCPFFRPDFLLFAFFFNAHSNSSNETYNTDSHTHIFQSINFITETYLNMRIKRRKPWIYRLLKELRIFLAKLYTEIHNHMAEMTIFGLANWFRCYDCDYMTVIVSVSVRVCVYKCLSVSYNWPVSNK